MPHHLNAQSQEHIAQFLPTALDKALSSYHAFMDQETPIDTKEFYAYHNAAKVAIAHVELLIKLGKCVEIPKETQDDLSLLLSQAEQDVHGYKTRQDMWEQDGEEE